MRIDKNQPDGLAVDEAGTRCWFKNRELHREDGPALERVDGTKEWWVNGQPHREDGPAVEWPNGNRFWFKNGLPHRDDGPAFEWSDGTREWYKDGQPLNRIDTILFELARHPNATQSQREEIIRCLIKSWFGDESKKEVSNEE